MPNPSTISRGNISGQWLVALTLSPTSVAPNTTVEQTFTCSGVLPGDMIDVQKPSVQAGLGIVNSRVSAANQIAIGFANTTAATITPTASESYLVQVSRPENLTGSVSSLSAVS